MNRLKELREERSWSVRKVDQQTSINYTTVARCENGQRDLTTDMCKSFATAYEVSIDYLLGYSDYCLYALYESGNYRVKIDDCSYKKFKEVDCIYFNNLGKRCIDINKLVGLNNDKNISTYIYYGNIINNINCMLKKSSSDKSVNSIDSIPDFNDQILCFIKDNIK